MDMIARARTKRPRDINQLAVAIARESVGEAEPQPADNRNPAAVALAQLGAKKGGEVRAKNLSARRRKEIAKKAAKARWSKTSS